MEHVFDLFLKGFGVTGFEREPFMLDEVPEFFNPV